jgi:hypothetical protein
MDSPETLLTLGTRHRTLEKTLESNDEWTVQSLVPNVASVSGLSIHQGPLRFSLTFYVLLPMLPVSLDCPFIIALYGFLSRSMSCSQCCQCFWTVHSSLPSTVFNKT